MRIAPRKPEEAREGRAGIRGPEVRLLPTPTHDPESAETLEAAANGDERAVRALYRAHVARIHAHVARILGPHHPDVEDVVQRVFLAALESASSFGGRSKVSSWLHGIATRRALDAARASWRRERWARIGERVGLGRGATRPDVRHEALTEAEALLQSLPPDQRTVFVLKEVEGHTFQEISDMTGVGISTLHARLKAARKRLDASMQAAELEEVAS